MERPLLHVTPQVTPQMSGSGQPPVVISPLLQPSEPPPMANLRLSPLAEAGPEGETECALREQASASPNITRTLRSASEQLALPAQSVEGVVIPLEEVTMDQQMQPGPASSEDARGSTAAAAQRREREVQEAADFALALQVHHAEQAQSDIPRPRFHNPGQFPNCPARRTERPAIGVPSVLGVPVTHMALAASPLPENCCEQRCIQCLPADFLAPARRRTCAGVCCFAALNVLVVCACADVLLARGRMPWDGKLTPEDALQISADFLEQ